MKDLSNMTSKEIERYVAWQKAQIEKYRRMPSDCLTNQLEVCGDEELRAIMLEVLAKRNTG